MAKKESTAAPLTVGEKKEFKQEDPLWCTVCQRGISGVANNDKYEEGDMCPMCLDRYRYRDDKESASGTLKKASTVVKEKEEYTRLVLIEKEKNKVRGIKGAKELVAESETKLKNQIADQAQQIANLEKMIKEQVNK